MVQGHINRLKTLNNIETAAIYDVDQELANTFINAKDMKVRMK
jgi:hypothetical protein